MMVPSVSIWKRWKYKAEKSQALLGGFLGLIFLFRTWRIFMDKAGFFLAEDGLKGTTTPGTIKGLLFRPACISALHVAKVHCIGISFFTLSIEESLYPGGTMGGLVTKGQVLLWNWGSRFSKKAFMPSCFSGEEKQATSARASKASPGVSPTSCPVWIARFAIFKLKAPRLAIL